MDKINAAKPFSYDNPDVPYDHVLPSVSFSPLIINDELRYQAALSCKLAREIDGVWDILPDNYYAEGFSNITAEAENDPDLATLVGTINSAISTFLASRGV